MTTSRQCQRQTGNPPPRELACRDVHTLVVLQGVIQDFEVEGGNEKSNQKMLLKKGQLLFHGHSVIIERGGKLELGGGYPPFPPLCDTLYYKRQICVLCVWVGVCVCVCVWVGGCVWCVCKSF